MENSIEVAAKTIDVAIENALAELGVGYADVDIEIISSGGMFKKAKIRATVKDGVAVKGAKVAATGAQAERDSGAQETVKTEENFEKMFLEKEKEKEKEQGRAKHRRSEFTSPRPIQAPVEIEPVVEIPGEHPEKLKVCRAFLEKLLSLLGEAATVGAIQTEKDLRLDISGDDVGRLIGKGGVTLAAFQSLVTSVSIANGEGERRRVFVNIENYKERREQTVRDLALRKAELVKSRGRMIKLDPMTPRDRAIAHGALGEFPGIKTYSVGKDPFRRLVIAPADGADGADNMDAEQEKGEQE